MSKARTKRAINDSKREVILQRTFKMSINCGMYAQNEYNEYCHWAKGKSESHLLSDISLVRELSS